MNKVLINSEGVISRKEGTLNSWVGNTKDISLPFTDAKLWASCSYYNSIESAMSDINAGQVASN